MMTYNEAKLTGPGFDGYAYRADVWCEGCGRDIIEETFGARDWQPMEDLESGDSGHLPQPVFFGEADTAQYCANCEAYLYGGEDE